MKTIYLSGAITGTDDYEVRFMNAEKKLIKENNNVLNPVKISKSLEEEVLPRKPTWVEYMKYTLDCMLRSCNAIYMLKGWEQSKGAVIEHNLAKDLGYEIIYEE